MKWPSLLFNVEEVSLTQRRVSFRFTVVDPRFPFRSSILCWCDSISPSLSPLPCLSSPSSSACFFHPSLQSPCRRQRFLASAPSCTFCLSFHPFVPTSSVSPTPLPPCLSPSSLPHADRASPFSGSSPCTL